MFDLSKTFGLSKNVALPNTLLKSKNYCTGTPGFSDLPTALEMIMQSKHGLAVYVWMIHFKKL